MGFRSFKSEEKAEVITLPNAITTLRGIGGTVLGVGMAKYNLDPNVTAAAAASLALSDAEGSLIGITSRFPRLQKALRIIPSSIGRIADPVADKIFTISVFAGGLMNGSIPGVHGVSILATELATTAVTGAATLKGKDPEVSSIGKVGMIARCGVIGFDLTAAAVEHGGAHDALMYGGHASAVAAVVLGAMSCYDLYRQATSEPLHSEVE